MRAVQALHPGRSDAQHVGEMSPDWFARCSAKRDASLADLEPHLGSTDSDTVMRYTMALGGAGVEREGYFAGWAVIGDLVRHGWTFPKAGACEGCGDGCVGERDHEAVGATTFIARMIHPIWNHKVYVLDTARRNE